MNVSVRLKADASRVDDNLTIPGADDSRNVSVATGNQCRLFGPNSKLDFVLICRPDKTTVDCFKKVLNVT